MLRLPEDVYSPDQLGIILWELGAISSQLRDSSTRATVTKTEQKTEVHTSALLLNVLQSAGVSAHDQPALEHLQAEIKTIREQAPSMHMMLAALPNRAMKRMIVEWLRREIHPQLLLTFSARGDIGGGFILRAGSKQYDFSFRGKILANKQRIVEIFDSVR
jgi:F0F1-type ATP synthase delta subunit